MLNIAYAIIGSYCIGWAILKFLHYLDGRQADKLRRAREITSHLD